MALSILITVTESHFLMLAKVIRYMHYGSTQHRPLRHHKLTIFWDPLLCCSPVREVGAPSPEAGRDQRREAASDEQLSLV